jgi:predicted DCC family thiol-disulfide oxidoreductase YuxK
MSAVADTDRCADRLARRAAYSYRIDPAVPAFPDDRPVIVYDGVCVLCSAAMRVIARRDTAAHFRFVNGQSAVGGALFRHYGLDPVNFETVLLIDEGRAFGKLDMTRRVADLIGGPWRLFEVFAILPGAMQDWCYDLIAKNRYRLFGRSDVCIAPDPSWRARIIE